MKLKSKLFFVCLFYILSLSASSQQADSLLRFIESHKSNSSLFLRVNDSVKSSLNPDKLLPLASTMKILVAIEFAKQASHYVLDINQKVSLSDLDKYYLPDTDGGAHSSWINYEKETGKISNDSVSMLDVAKGMMMFSSNANTEFLMDLLGLENINRNYDLMGVKNYTPIYYLASSVCIYKAPKNTSEKKFLKQLNSLSQQQYIDATKLIHQQLKLNPSFKKTVVLSHLSVDAQRMWTERLPASTTRGYARIMSILNNRLIYSERTYEILSKLIETLMQNPNNKKWLIHAGKKGGSTLSLLSEATYATLQNGDKVELAFILDNLKPGEMQQLQQWLNLFEYKILTDPSFRNHLSGIN